jgi:hypothetical protein
MLPSIIELLKVLNKQGYALDVKKEEVGWFLSGTDVKGKKISTTFGLGEIQQKLTKLFQDEIELYTLLTKC